MPVLISLNRDGEALQFDLEDVNEGLLRDVFDLERPPRFLRSGNRIVTLKGLVEGEKYFIPSEGHNVADESSTTQPDGSSIAKATLADRGDPDLAFPGQWSRELRNAVLVAHVASIGHAADNAKVKEVLSKGDGLTQIVRSTHGKHMSIVIADTVTGDHVYIGIASTMAWNTEETALVDVSRELGIAGKVHPLVLEAKKMFPIESVMHHSGQKKLVLCGFGLGGAVACLWSIVLDHLFSSSSSEDAPMCFTFGAPAFYDMEMREFVQHELKGHTFHMHSDRGPYTKLGQTVSPAGHAHSLSSDLRMKKLEHSAQREIFRIGKLDCDALLALVMSYVNIFAKSAPLSNVIFTKDFTPNIGSARLLIEDGVDSNPASSLVLQVLLEISGTFLSSCLLEECTFSFGFPFPAGKDVDVQNNFQTLAIRSQMDRTDLQPMPDHGSVIAITTPFGQCSFRMTKDMFKSCHSHQSKGDELPYLVIRTAFQRAMALKEISRKGGPEGQVATKIEELLQEIVEISLGSEGLSTLKSLVDSTMAIGVGRAFSVESDYKSIKEFLDKMEESLNKSLKIEPSVWYRVALTACTIGGMLSLIGLTGGALSWAGITFSILQKGMLSSVIFGMGKLYTPLPEKEEIKSYAEFLTMIVAHLEEQAVKESHDDDFLSQIKHLKEEGTLSSLEKALSKLWEGNGAGLESTFSGQDKAFKHELERRINCTIKISQLRDILSKQCFIGVIGNQDAGKTTMLNKMFGFSGETGQFTHTKVPVFHQLEETEVYVVDYPGSSSLEEHANTFSICGVMNNLVIVIVPFTGDLSDVVTNTLSKVFSAMQDTASSRVILCINKCSYGLQDAIREELKAEKDPISYLKKTFAEKITSHFAYETDSKNFQIDPECILFTDWKLPHDHEYRRLGIVGIEAVEGKIAAFLEEKNADHIPDVFHTTKAWILARNSIVAINAASRGIDKYKDYIVSTAGIHSFSRAALGQFMLGATEIQIFIGEINGDLNNHVIIAFHASNSYMDHRRDLKPGPNRLPQGEYCMHHMQDSSAILETLQPFIEAKFYNKTLLFCGYGTSGILAALIALQIHKSKKISKGPAELNLPHCMTFETPLFCSQLNPKEYKAQCFIHLVEDRGSATPTNSETFPTLRPIGEFAILLQDDNFRKLSKSQVQGSVDVLAADQRSAEHIQDRIRRIWAGKSTLPENFCSTDFSESFCHPEITSAKLRVAPGSEDDKRAIQLVIHGHNLECFQVHLCEANWSYPFIDKSVACWKDPFSKALVFERAFVRVPEIGTGLLVITTAFGRAQFDDIKMDCDLAFKSKSNQERKHVKLLKRLLKLTIFRGLHGIDEELLKSITSMDRTGKLPYLLAGLEGTDELCRLRRTELIEYSDQLVSSFVNAEYSSQLQLSTPDSTKATAPQRGENSFWRMGFERVAPILGLIRASVPESVVDSANVQEKAATSYFELLNLLTFKGVETFSRKCKHCSSFCKASTESGTAASEEEYLAHVFQEHGITDLQLGTESEKVLENFSFFLQSLTRLRQTEKHHSVIAFTGTMRTDSTTTAQNIFPEEFCDVSLIIGRESHGLSMLSTGAKSNFHVVVPPRQAIYSAAIMADAIVLVLSYSNEPDLPISQAELDPLRNIQDVDNVHNNIYVLVDKRPPEQNTMVTRVRCAAQVNEALLTWIVETKKVFFSGEEDGLRNDIKNCLESLGKAVLMSTLKDP